MLQVVVVGCIDVDQVINWQMKFRVVKHRIITQDYLFLSRFCVVVDMFCWLNEGSLSCNGYIVENVIVGYSSSQKANEMSSIVWKGVENRTKSIIRPLLMSWYNCGLEQQTPKSM